MKTYPLRSEGGELVGFEVSHSFLSSAGIARFVSRVTGAEVTHTRRSFLADEVHVRFRFYGMRFIVWEPFRDNSRLWVGPDDGETVDVKAISALQSAFRSTNRWKLLA